MKNAKEKAIELVNIFSTVGLQQREEGIACALICVEEILKLDLYASEQYYWKNVEKEIKKL